MTIPPIINIVQSSSLTAPLISVTLSGSVNASASPLLTSQSIPTVVVTMHDALTAVANFANSATSASVAQLAYAGSGSFTGSFQGALIGSASGNFTGTSNATGSWLGSYSGSIVATGSLIGSVTGVSNTTGSLLGTLTGSVSATGSVLGTVSGSLTGNFVGSVTATTLSASLVTPSTLLASNAVSASYAVTSSYIRLAPTASYAPLATSASYATTASFAINSVPITGSSEITGSLTVDGILTANKNILVNMPNTASLNIQPAGLTFSDLLTPQTWFFFESGGSFLFQDNTHGAYVFQLVPSATPIFRMWTNMDFNVDNTNDIGTLTGNRPRNINIANSLNIGGYSNFGGPISSPLQVNGDAAIGTSLAVGTSIRIGSQFGLPRSTGSLWVIGGTNQNFFSNNAGTSGILLESFTTDPASSFTQTRNSPVFTFRGSYWNGSSTSTLDIGTIQGQMTGPASNLGKLVLNCLGAQWSIQGNGGSFGPESDNTYDIGQSSSNRPRNIYVANQLTSLLVNTGEVYSNTSLLLQAGNGADIAFDNGATENMRLFAGGLARITNTLQVGMPRSGSNNITLWSNAHASSDTNDNYGYGTIEVRKQDGVPTGASDVRGNEMVFTNRSWLASNSSGFKFIYSGSNLGGYNLLELVNNGVSKLTVDNNGSLSLAGSLNVNTITGGNAPIVISSSYGSTSSGVYATQFNNSSGPHGLAYSWQDGGTNLLTLRGTDTTNGPAAQLTLYGPLIFNSDNAYDIGVTGSVNRPRNLWTANSVNTPAVRTDFIQPYAPGSNPVFQFIRADSGGKPLQIDLVNGQHAALNVMTSVSGAAAWAGGGFQVIGTLQTDIINVYGTLVAGKDQLTSGWTSIPIRPGRPTGNANDVPGLDLTVQSGQGTGVGARAGIQFQVGWYTGSTNQTLHPMQTGMYLTSGSLIVSGTVNMMVSKTPASTSDTSGQVGDIARDDNYIYVKTSAGWKRAALSTF